MRTQVPPQPAAVALCSDCYGVQTYAMPLHRAARSGHTDVVALLLADPRVNLDADQAS